MTTHIRFLCSPLVLLIYVLFTYHVLLVQSVSVHLPSLQMKDISARQDGTSPEFPQNPPSCPLCEQNYANINSCAAAAPVFANFSMVRQTPISVSFLVLTRLRSYSTLVHSSASSNVHVRTPFNLLIRNVLTGELFFFLERYAMSIHDNMRAS